MRSLALLVLAAFAGSALAQAPSDVDRAVLQHLQRTKTPGCSVAIVKDGQVTFSKGYGLANIETDTAATPETVYRIGSLTKPFTAMLVMAHVEKGELSLDDPIVKHLPDLPKAFEKVTVRQLLNHTSGIASYTNLPAFVKQAREIGTAKEMIDMSAAAPVDFAPGASWKYNNTGYIVLGELVAKLEGRPWAQAVTERIAKPLGLENTRPSDPAAIVKNRASGYAPDANGVKNAAYLDLSWPYSAGAMESTVLDLAKWESSLGRLLKPETLNAMTTPSGAAKTYGLGWSVADVNGVRIVSHGGAIPGFHAFLGRVPAKKTAVIVLTNSSAGQADALGRQILGLAVPEVAPKTTVIADDDPAMTTFLRGKFDRLLRGELQSDELTPEFGKILTPTMIQDIKGTLGALGAVNKFDLIESKKVGDNTVRSYLIDLGGNNLTVVFSVAPDKKIAGITVKG
jgi:CubicO group peptidase (beta-lactamase class C family)